MPVASTSAKAVAMKSVLTPVMTLKGHGEPISSISYFPDGRRMISGSNGKTARRWDLNSGKEIEEARVVCELGVQAVAVSRDGRWVVTAGGDGFSTRGELKACEVETGIVKTFKGHSQLIMIKCIDISADSKLLASGSDDCTARIWNLETGELVAGPFESDDWVGAVRFSTDSNKLAIQSGSGRRLEVWDVQKQELDRKFETASVLRFPSIFIAKPIFWTNKNKNILAAFSFTEDDHDGPKTIYEFDASTLEPVGTPFEGHTEIVSSLALSSDCTLLASASDDNTIKLWAFESRQLLASFHVRYPSILVFSPDSCQLAYATGDWPSIDHNIYICNTPPNVLAKARTNARTINNLLNSDATRRPPAGRRRPPISLMPTVQRPPPVIDPQPPMSLRLRKLLRFSFRTNTAPQIQNDQLRSPPDFPATSSLPSNRLHAASPPSTPLFIRSSSDKAKQKTHEQKCKPAEVVDVPLGQATYGDAVGVDDGIRPYVLFFCLSWFQKKEKKQVPRPVYDDELEDDEEEEDILNQVAAPHTGVQHEEIELKTVASQSQSRAGPSRPVHNVDILNRVAMPHPRVPNEEVGLKMVASQSQSRAGPSRRVNNDDILNRVAMPHPRVPNEEIGLKMVASQSQSRAGPSRRVKIDDILNRVAVPHPRVQHEEIEVRTVASRSQPEAGPSRLAITVEHPEAQSS